MVRNVINRVRSFLASRHYRVHQFVSIEGYARLITAKHLVHCDTVAYLLDGDEQLPYHQLRKATEKEISLFFELTSESEAFDAEEAA